MLSGHLDSGCGWGWLGSLSSELHGLHERLVSTRLLTKCKECLIKRQRANGPGPVKWSTDRPRCTGSHASGTFPEHLRPTPKAFPSLEVCSTVLTSLGQHRQAIRKGTHSAWETGGHDWGEGGRAQQRETEEGLARLRPRGRTAHNCQAGALLPACRGRRGRRGPGAGGGAAGGWGPSQACHLSACCSSRSTASARLSTYPSAFTSGWCSSLGLESGAVVSQLATPCRLP